MDLDELCPSKHAKAEPAAKQSFVPDHNKLLPPTRVNSGSYDGYRHAVVYQPDGRGGIALVIVGPDNWSGIKQAVDDALDNSSPVDADFDAPENAGVKALAELAAKITKSARAE